MQNSTKKNAVTEVLVIRKGTRQEVSEKVLEGRKGCNQLNLKTWQETNPPSFAKTHEQFGITHIPDVLQIKCNFNGQVHDPRTTEE